MRWGLWLAVGAVAYLVASKARPGWYDDLMLRAYAVDHLTPPPTDPEKKAKFDEAAKAAASAGLPVGWVLELAGKTSGADVKQLAKYLVDRVKAMGPPKDQTEAGLSAYKAAVLGG